LKPIYKLLTIAVFILGGLCSLNLNAQGNDAGSIQGNFQIDTQYYNEDSLIGAIQPEEQQAMNAYGYLTYSKGGFQVGGRYEFYGPSLLGYPAGSAWDGSGIGYRFASYQNDDMEITVGNFYEQFGSGMIFRAYEERFLGVDNAMDGVRIRYNPYKGVYLKGVYGRQRLAFDSKIISGSGILRGGDLEVNFNELIESMKSKKTKVTFGSSFISRYQGFLSSDFELPKNVAAYGARLTLRKSKVSLSGEYAYKINDPNGSNNNIFKPGQGLTGTAVFSQKGFSVLAKAQIIDNMSFSSSRYPSSPFDLNVNFVPPVMKQHTYNLPATLYPYATAINGEIGLSGEVIYKFKKTKNAVSGIDKLLGGKYGTKVTIGYAQANTLDTTHFSSDDATEVEQFEADPSRQGYTTKLFSLAGRNMIKDLNIEIDKKINKKWKFKYTYFNLVFDKSLIQKGVFSDKEPVIFADIHVADVSYKINKKHNLRVELQNLTSKQDQGDWGTALIEYTVSPHWFLTVMDQYNYGNDVEEQKIHYPIVSAGFLKKSTRLEVRYGKQRAGIFCVGGVCRVVPASNGLAFSISSSF
jgi:hypothetical protein